MWVGGGDGGGTSRKGRTQQNRSQRVRGSGGPHITFAETESDWLSVLSVALPSNSLDPAKLRGDGSSTHCPLQLEFWEQVGQPETSPAPVSERRAAPKSHREANSSSSIIATRSCIGLERGERGGSMWSID